MRSYTFIGRQGRVNRVTVSQARYTSEGTSRARERECAGKREDGMEVMGWRREEGIQAGGGRMFRREKRQ
jgi:hypothetical protein